MKKTAMILTALSTLTAAYAGDLTVDNQTGEDIQVFIRGKDATKKHVRQVIQSNRKNANAFVINTSNLPALANYSVYEVIASASRNGGDPDWKLLAGECTNLDKDGDQKIIITKSGLGLKTSCEVVIPGN